MQLLNTLATGFVQWHETAKETTDGIAQSVSGYMQNYLLLIGALIALKVGIGFLLNMKKGGKKKSKNQSALEVAHAARTRRVKARWERRR